MNKSRIAFHFMTQEEADAAVVALSKHYQVTQTFCNVSSGLPYLVNVIVPTSDVYPKEE